MSSAQKALDELQVEIDAFNQGTKHQPRPQTVEWFLLRAKVTGAAYLKRVVQLSLESDEAACERLYRKCSSHFKVAEVPPEVVVPRETLPESLPAQ